jgi:hypothetical protein
MQILFFLFGIVIFILMPLAGIWALDTLFGLSIPYTFQTWLAAFLLFSLVSGKEYVNISRSE